MATVMLHLSEQTLLRRPTAIKSEIKELLRYYELQYESLYRLLPNPRGRQAAVITSTKSTTKKEIGMDSIQNLSVTKYQNQKTPTTLSLSPSYELDTIVPTT